MLMASRLCPSGTRAGRLGRLPRVVSAVVHTFGYAECSNSCGGSDRSRYSIIRKATARSSESGGPRPDEGRPTARSRADPGIREKSPEHNELLRHLRGLDRLTKGAQSDGCCGGDCGGGAIR